MKVHEKNGIRILAVCDEVLLDKVFVFNGVSVKISKDFYFNKCIDKEELRKILEREKFEIINVFGNEIVDFLINIGLINDKNVLIICGQKHAIIQTL